MANEHFKAIFTTTYPIVGDIADVTTKITSRISPEMQARFDEASTVVEFRAAVFETSSTMAPGPDGFHGSFY